MTLQINKHNIYYNKLYEYKRNLPVEIVKKLNEYTKEKNESLKLNEKKIMIRQKLRKQMFGSDIQDIHYKKYHMKLITFDILINKSFSFKCLKTNEIFRSNKSFHLVFQNEHVNIQEGLDDIIVYVFDKISIPFFVCIGGGGRGSCLSNEIYIVYYYTQNYIYSFNEDILTSNESKILLCNRILEYYKNNTIFNSKQICTTYGYLANMGHTYWNELSAFKILIDFDLLKNIDLFIIGGYDYYNIYDYLHKNKYNVIREPRIENINSNLNGNSLLFKYNDIFMYEDLKTFVLETNNLNDNDLSLKITTVKQNHYPIVTFNLRGVWRYLYNQEDCFIKIINTLLLLYPNMFVIFDGYVKNKNVLLDNYATENSSANEYIFDKSYYDIVNTTISGINTTNYISLIGTTIDVQLAWLDISNYGILQTGSGNTNYAWVLNKKSIVIGKNPIMNDEALLYTFQDLYYRENRNFTTYINPEFINFESYKNCNSVFYIDWKILLFHIIRDLCLLEKNQYSLSQITNINSYNIYMYFGLDEININSLLDMDLNGACNIIKTFINTKM